MAENREFLSIPEVAALMGVSRIAVFKKVKKGQLPAIRIGRNWAIAAAALQSPTLSPAPNPALSPGKARPKSGARPAAVPPAPKAVKPKSAVVHRPISIFKPAPEKDSLDEMGWD